MGDHAVVGAHGQAVDVPGAHHRLPGFGLGEHPRVAQGLDSAGELGRRGGVDDQYPTGDEYARRFDDVLPGGEHVQHDAVDVGVGNASGGDVGEITGAQLPGGMMAPEPGVDVGRGDPGEVLAPLDGQQAAGFPDGR